MKKSLLTIFALILLFACGEKNQDRTKSEESGDSAISTTITYQNTLDSINELDSFILEGYEILDLKRADINSDNRADAILVLKLKGEDTLSSDASRPLLLLTRDVKGKLNLVRQNDNTVYCFNCGGMMGDPYVGITVKGNYFSVEHYGGSGGGRWSKIVTYKFDSQHSEWFLHQDGSEFFGWNPNTDPDAEAIIKTGEKILTSDDFGKVTFEKYNINN